MESEWKNVNELDKVIDCTKGEILKCKKELERLESYLTWLNTEKINLCNNELIQDNKLREEAERKHNSFNSHKRHLPIVPNRQMSESESSSPIRRSMMTLPRSSTSSFVSKSSWGSPMGNKRAVSCSLENLSLIGQKMKPNTLETASVKGKKFSTIDFSFLKKLTSYTKSPKKDGSAPTASVSSLDDVLSESFNSLTTSADDLDVDGYKSSKSDEGKSSSRSIEDVANLGYHKSSLHRNKPIYTKKKTVSKQQRCELLTEIDKELKWKDALLGDNVSLLSNQSLPSDDISLDNLSFSDSGSCYGNSGYSNYTCEEQTTHETGATTSSSSISSKSEKELKKNKLSSKHVSQNTLLIDDDNVSTTASLYSVDCDAKLVAVENFLQLEKAYVEKLQILVENYEQALREHSKDSLTLRHNVNTVFHHPCHFLMIHKSFLIAAQHRFNKQSSGATVPVLFGDLFLEMVNQFKVYIEYARDFTFIMDTLSVVETQYVQTKELMNTIGREVGISLPDLFHVPLRQVETYQHLITNVRHHMLASNETVILEEAEYKLEEITNTIDRIMADIRKKTKSSRKRELIHKGMMAGQNEKSALKMRYLFLYNDVLICARMPRTTDHASLYLPKWYLPLSDILLPLTHDPGKTIDTIQLKQLKVRIKELQRLIREEENTSLQELNKGVRPVSKRMRGFRKQRQKTLRDSLRDKLEEYQILHMVLPFKIISKRGKTYTMHLHAEKERDEWMKQIQTQLNKVPACTANITLSNGEVESLLERYTKLRKDSTIARLDVDNEDEIVYDGVLLVQVICGTDLGDAGSKPDVYCTLEADCNGVMCKKNKTKLVKGTINPIWDETLCIPAEACQFLRLRAYGKKQFQRPIEIGIKLLTLADYNLDDNRPIPLQVSLQPKGQIKLTIQLLSQEMARLRKESHHQTFGVPLDELALIEGQKIPPIIHSCFTEIEKRGVTEEGIYRISGVVGEIRRLKSAFDESSKNGSILACEAEVNVVAGVVKQFFRELPKPLFPVEMYNDFVELLESEDIHDKVKLLSCFGDIPEPNISVIVRLIQHMQYIAEYQPKNKMDINNLCLLFGPNVVKPPATTGEQTCELLTTVSMQQVNILKFFCEKPLYQLQDLHGDEESLQRPGSAPPILSPTSERNVAPIVRHVSIASLSHADMTEEDDYNFDMFSPLDEDKADPLTDVSSLVATTSHGSNTDISNGNCFSPISEIGSDVGDPNRQSVAEHPPAAQTNTGLSIALKSSEVNVESDDYYDSGISGSTGVSQEIADNVTSPSDAASSSGALSEVMSPNDEKSSTLSDLTPSQSLPQAVEDLSLSLSDDAISKPL